VIWLLDSVAGFPWRLECDSREKWYRTHSNWTTEILNIAWDHLVDTDAETRETCMMVESAEMVYEKKYPFISISIHDPQ
jgi:hypothetical protein